jgi:hypothetical protein
MPNVLNRLRATVFVQRNVTVLVRRRVELDGEGVRTV